jgi:hypothetical protein
MERLGFEIKESMRSLIDEGFCEMRKPVLVRPAFFIPWRAGGRVVPRLRAEALRQVDVSDLGSGLISQNPT